MTIEIRALSLEAILGILPEERKTPQPLRVDLRADYHYKEGHYLDYAAIAEEIVEILRKGRFGLIEEALETLGLKLMERHAPIGRLTIRIEKPAILPYARVAVEHSWERS